jgi:hypothetical protein
MLWAPRTRKLSNSISLLDFHQDAECSNYVGNHRDKKRERAVNEIPDQREDRQQQRYNYWGLIRRMNFDFHCRKPTIEICTRCFSNDDQSSADVLLQQ